MPEHHDPMPGRDPALDSARPSAENRFQDRFRGRLFCVGMQPFRRGFHWYRSRATTPARTFVAEGLRVKTYILIQAVPGVDLRALAREVGRLPGVERVEVVTGPYDLIAEGHSEDPRAQRHAISELERVLRTAAALVAGARDREPAAT